MTGQDDKNKLLEMLLEKCDALYQENARLKAREKEIEAESKQTESYKNKIAELESKVSKLTQDLEYLRRKFWVSPAKSLFPKIQDNASLILKDSIFFPRKKHSLLLQHRKLQNTKKNESWLKLNPNLYVNRFPKTLKEERNIYIRKALTMKTGWNSPLK